MRATVALLSAVALLAAGRAVAAQALPERVRERLSAEPSDALRPLLARFYEQRGYRPAWVSDSNPSPAVAALVRMMETAGVEGLDPNDYPHARIRALLGRGRAPDTLVQLELLLSRALLGYGSDVSRGRIDPAAADSPWTAAPDTVDLVAALAIALDSGRIAEALERLTPPQPPYARLRQALAHYRDVAVHGGWSAFPSGPDLIPGTADWRVSVLRARLVAEADLTPSEDSGEVYDSAAAQAVRRFQSRHGLEPDGVVGRATLAALNLPVEMRIHQIELNLERWRWLPHRLELRYVMVNSAAFTLEVVDSGRRMMAMQAIVGRPDRPTPIVSGEITGLVFSPVWNIPRTIAREEVLPLIERDPAYVQRHRITVSEDSETFDLQVKQAPGGENPLGGVKIVFGSRFNVCIHDTPARSLFAERVRPFSHGCVRVERAADLAAYLLQDSVRWTEDSVRIRMTSATEHVVALSPPIPVHLAYWTAWVDDEGTVEFRDDVYGWDTRLADALARRRASSPSLPLRAP